MNPSPLELEHYNLICLHIEELERRVSKPKERHVYVSLDKAEIRASVDIGVPAKSGKRPRYAIRLRLLVEPREGESFPYRADVGIEGFFNVHASKDAVDARQLAAVNGTSMLYSVVREVVLSQTLRFRSGPLMLPSVHFLHLKEAVVEDPPAEQKPRGAESIKASKASTEKPQIESGHQKRRAPAAK